MRHGSTGKGLSAVKNEFGEDIVGAILALKNSRITILKFGKAFTGGVGFIGPLLCATVTSLGTLFAYLASAQMRKGKLICAELQDPNFLIRFWRSFAPNLCSTFEIQRSEFDPSGEVIRR